MHAPDGLAAPWEATAAYLYLLGLDPPALAWEYLRRASAYRACWRRYGRRAPVYAARPWGLAQLEDPFLDARRAHPVWDDRLPALLHVQAVDDGGVDSTAGLDLWRLPGAKYLVALPAGFALLVRDGPHWLRLRLGNGVLDGGPALYAVPLDTRLRAQAALLAAQAARFAPGRRKAAARPAGSACRVPLASLYHLRALQALDGMLAGASQRRIAQVLYGQDQADRYWHADSALRAQLRHSLARGQALMRGSYRELAGLRPSRPDA